MYAPTLADMSAPVPAPATGAPLEQAAGVADPVSRRELNKVRTREAITGALRTLVQQQPAHKVTVDQLAETAGISRRTLFNYYAGIPAVLAEVIGESTEHLAAAIGEFTPGVSPLGRLRELIATVGLPVDLIEWMALLNSHPGSDATEAEALERAIWAEKGAWLEGLLAERLPAGAESLYVGSLAQTIMHCFAAAERSWVAERSPDAPVDAQAVADYHRILDRALGYAEHGWAEHGRAEHGRAEPRPTRTGA